MDKIKDLINNFEPIQFNLNWFIIVTILIFIGVLFFAVYMTKTSNNFGTLLGDKYFLYAGLSGLIVYIMLRIICIVFK